MFEDAKGNGGSANGGGGGGSLAGYATQAWVNEGFVSIEFFNRLFTVYGPGETSSDPDVVVAPNDLDSTIKNIKAMFGLWTEQYLSALGLNPGGTGSATSLSMLDDVDITTPTNGQALVYNATSQKWENQTISTVTALANLTDVLLTSPANHEFLMYDGVRWINSAIKTINGQPLYGSGDISVGGGASGNYLPLTGGRLTGDDFHLLELNRTTNNGVGIGFFKQGTELGDIGFNRNGEFMIRNGVAETTRFLIKTNGYVGIGTSSPNNPLQIDDYDNYRILRINRTESNSGAGIGFSKAGDLLGDIGMLSNATFAVRHGSGSMIEHFSVNQFGETLISCTAFRCLVVNRLSSNGAGIGFSYNGTLFGDIGFLSNNSFVIRDSNSTEFVHISSAGLFGIGTETPNNKLHVEGSARITGYLRISTDTNSYSLNVGGTVYATGNVVALSDIKQKNVEQYDAHLGFEDVANAPIIKFTWKDPKAEDKGLQVGSIAQYWEKVLPEAVKRDKEGTLSMSYGVVALVAAISTAKKVQEHERRIADLERENKELKERLKIA